MEKSVQCIFIYNEMEYKKGIKKSAEKQQHCDCEAEKLKNREKQKLKTREVK